jgi:hypothetical protein
VLETIAGCEQATPDLAQRISSSEVAPHEEAEQGPMEPDEAPPVSETVGAVPSIPGRVDDPTLVFRGMLERAGAANTLVVRARINGASVQPKVLPELLSWGPDMIFATRLGLTVLETICGASWRTAPAS